MSEMRVLTAKDPTRVTVGPSGTHGDLRPPASMRRHSGSGSCSVAHWQMDCPRSDGSREGGTECPSSGLVQAQAAWLGVTAVAWRPLNGNLKLEKPRLKFKLRARP